MRRLALFAGGLGLAVAIGAGLLFAFPSLLEKSIEWSCLPGNPNERCNIRMRAMGHLWSDRREFERARTWYLRAAEEGDVASMFHLAWTHEQIGNLELAAAERRMAGQPGEQAIQLTSSLRGASSSFGLAASWYRKAADRGFSSAMNNLAELYEVGKGVPQDKTEAFQWHLRAAQAGYPVAALNAAMDYRMGRGVPADAAEADRWLSMRVTKDKAEEIGDETLGRMNVMGLPIPTEARRLFQDADAHGVAPQMELRPLQPNAELPSFHRLQE